MRLLGPGGSGRESDRYGQTVQPEGLDSRRREGHPTELGVVGCCTLWGRRWPSEGTREIGQRHQGLRGVQCRVPASRVAVRGRESG